MTQWGLDNLFNPGKRHMDDEKRRLQSTREEIGDSSGGRRIDLEGGKVSISVPRPASTTDTAPEPDEDTALEPALEVEDVPALALANDEAEIEPEVAGEEAAPVPAAVESPEAEAPAAETTTDQDEPADDEPAAAPEPVVAAAPEPAPAARRRLSAKAWSRGG